MKVGIGNGRIGIGHLKISYVIYNVYTEMYFAETATIHFAHLCKAKKNMTVINNSAICLQRWNVI